MWMLGLLLKKLWLELQRKLLLKMMQQKLFLLLNLVSLQFLIWILRVQRHLLLHITRRLKVKIAILLLWPMLILRW